MNVMPQIFDFAEQQFQPECIGTKVLLDQEPFINTVLNPSIEKFEKAMASGTLSPSKEKGARIGHYVIAVEDSVAPEVFSCGIGAHTDNPEDYVVRKWRNKVQLFLRRRHAARVTSAQLIVYTRDAFLADPQVTDEQKAWLEENTTHVLITCLTAGGPLETQLTPHRWVHNLAGGNSFYDPVQLSAQIMEESGYDEELAEKMDPKTLIGTGVVLAVKHFVSEAVVIANYDHDWCVVAD